MSDVPAIESERRLQEMMRAEACATLGSRLGSLGVSAPLSVAVGDIVDTVVDRAGELGTDLVVIGRGLIPAPFGRLRTHAYGVIQRSPCPVLTV